MRHYWIRIRELGRDMQRGQHEKTDINGFESFNVFHLNLCHNIPNFKYHDIKLNALPLSTFIFLINI